MSETINFVNNFKNLQADFKKDTNLDAASNMGMYLQYYNARMSDNLFQLTFASLNRYLNEFNFLPGKIATAIKQSNSTNF